MSRVRLFDHDEAYARYLAGETQTAIAASYGVTIRAVGLLIVRRDPERHEAWKAYHREYQRRVLRRPCIRGCGRLAWHGRGSEGVCRRCRSQELSQSVRDDTLRCCECREWKPDASFPAQSARIARRGRHSVCRPCQTVARARARERQKTPCANCGTLRLADPRNRDSGLCRRCFLRSLKKAAA